MTRRDVAVAVFYHEGLQLVEALVPCWKSASAPIKAKIIKFFDALLSQIFFLALRSLTGHPYTQRSMTLRNIAVAMFDQEGLQLTVAVVPCRDCASRAPVKAKSVKLLDALLGQSVVLALRPLTGHPSPQSSVTLRNVAMAVLGLEGL